jgi:hypothetical protein
MDELPEPDVSLKPAWQRIDAPAQTGHSVYYCGLYRMRDRHRRRKIQGRGSPVADRMPKLTSSRSLAALAEFGKSVWGKRHARATRREGRHRGATSEALPGLKVAKIGDVAGV